MKKPKFLLITFHRDNLGIRYISSLLRKERFPTTLLIYHIETLKKHTNLRTKELVEAIKKVEPDIIGISTDSLRFPIAIKITKIIKKEVDVPIIWGGIHPTIAPEECIKFADMICRGEGEYAILELARRLERGKKIDNIKNIWIKKGDRIIKNPVRPLIRNIDSLPFPTYFTDEIYLSSTKFFFPSIYRKMYGKVYPIMATRGCIFSCSFCYNSYFRNLYGNESYYVRRRSVKNVIKELVWAKKINPSIKQVYFHDDIFVGDEKWVEKFSREYRRNIHLPFCANLHPKILNEKILSLLIKAGLCRVGIGLESISAVGRKIYKRDVSKKEILKAIELLKKLGMKNVCLHIILENPLESEKDLRENFLFLLKIIKIFPEIKISLFSLVLFPNYEITSMLKKRGKIKKWLFNFSRPITLVFNRWYPKREIDYWWDVLFIILTFKFSRNSYAIKLLEHISRKKPPLFVAKILLRILLLLNRVIDLVKEILTPYQLFFGM